MERGGEKLVKKSRFNQLINQNREEILKDHMLLEKIDVKLDEKFSKENNNSGGKGRS